MKKYPFEIKEDYYSPGLNSLKRLYTRHPKFNANTRLIYELLFDYWSADHGYAFPTIAQLRLDSDLSKGGVTKQIDTLVELDLVEKRPSPIGHRKNNVYIVKAPLANEKEFYARFPEAQAHFEALRERVAKEEDGDKARLSSTRGTVFKLKSPLNE